MEHEIKVEIKRGEDLDKLFDSIMTVEDLTKMRVESAIERAKKTLVLPLKRKWFDMIKSGEKKEEYREFNEFWNKRLLWTNKYPEERREKFNGFLIFDTLVFTLGYPKADDMERRLVFKNPRIRIGDGRPEWGAEPGKLYFVITWEE